MSMESVSTIIISVLGAGIVSILTVYFSRKQFLIQDDKQNIIKAIELSELYAREIIPLIDYFSYIYCRIGITEYYKKINKNRVESTLKFTLLELKETFTAAEINEIRSKMDPQNIKKEILINARVSMHNSRIDDAIFFKETQKNFGSKEEYERILRAYLVDDFNLNKNKLANYLEFFAMYFTSKTAHADSVYQSLHQTYIAILSWMYFDIASTNKDPKEKFYTNAIMLFNRWNDKYKEKIKKEKVHLEKSEMELVECFGSYK